MSAQFVNTQDMWLLLHVSCYKVVQAFTITDSSGMTLQHQMEQSDILLGFICPGRILLLTVWWLLMLSVGDASHGHQWSLE